MINQKGGKKAKNEEIIDFVKIKYEITNKKVLINKKTKAIQKHCITKGNKINTKRKNKKKGRRQKKMKKILKESEKGITLIALVITIIVLLILAGVTIATLTGDNGILTRANEAKTETEEGREEELRKLTALEATTKLEEHVYEDLSGKRISIPAKCAVSQVDGENTLENGLVIIDENGNEWVWIEIPRTEEVYQNVGINLNINNITDAQCDTIYKDLSNYVGEYREDGYKDTFYSTEQHGFADAGAYNEVKNNILRSIYKYEGFWIGRYEVGDADATISNTTRTDSTGKSNKAVIQRNQIPYNYVTCKEAQELSTELSIEGKKSSLMLGIQWDLTCKLIQLNTNLDVSDINVDSKKWGNYRDSSVTVSRGKYNINPSKNGIWTSFIENNINNFISNSTNPDKNYFQLLTSGASETTNKMNIYDIAGNVWEFTLETSNQQYIPCILRGGGYWSSSYTDESATYRQAIGTNNKSDSWGFRTVLY